jgi:glutamate-ammonia-ligase adenylyltransferase
LLEKLDERAVAVVARVLALSAPLSRSLSRLARVGGVDDALLFGIESRRASALALDRLFRSAVAGDDDETTLAALSRLQQELVFSAALPFLAGRIPAVAAQQRLSGLADAVLRAAVNVAGARLERRHGRVPGLRFSVVALGSHGGRELGFFRDLDLAFVYDVDTKDGSDGSDVESTGKRPVTAAEWATRMAQQVLWVLCTPTDGAALYPTDTRLRPSGNQGALTTSLARFREYHAGESALWERQSLLRLRPVAGDVDLGRAVVAVVAGALRKPAPLGLGLRLLDMRARMVEERATDAGLDVKLGEGGIADVEFAVQGAQLAAALSGPSLLVTSTRRALSRLHRRGHLRAIDAAALRAALDLLVHVREALTLVDDAKHPAVLRRDPRLDKLARSGTLAFAKDGDVAWQKIVEAMAVVREISGRVLMRLT